MLDIAIIIFASIINAMAWPCYEANVPKERAVILFTWPIMYGAIVFLYLFGAYVLWSDKRNGHD